MSWHDPELYLFLCLLAGFAAALLAITYELFSRRRKPPVILMKAADAHDWPSAAGRLPAERESKRPSDSAGFARAPRTSRRRSKQAACVNISESSEECAGPFHDGAEQAKKSLPTQIHTRRGSAARTTLTYTPLAVGGDKQTFGAEQQVPHVSGSYKEADGSTLQFLWHRPKLPSPVAGSVRCRSFLFFAALKGY